MLEFCKENLTDLIADVDLDPGFQVIEGFLQVSSPGRSQITGIGVSLQNTDNAPT